MPSFLHIIQLLALMSLSFSLVGAFRLAKNANVHRLSHNQLRMSTLSFITSEPKVLVAIADGTEEIEAVTIIDTLVRGGAKVTVASVESNLQVICSRGVKLVADKSVGECVDEPWDAVCIPGGMPGAERLRDSASLKKIIDAQNSKSKLIGSICAAPAVVLATYGVLKGKTATCYPVPKFQNALEKGSTDLVVIDGHIVTSQGPGTALKFSLKLVELLRGQEVANKISSEMLA